MHKYSGSIDSFKQRIDIVDVVGRVVRLRRTRHKHVGLCPFHSEKSASFFVDENSQLYHCFGCGDGGDVIAFVRRFHNVGFLEALKMLSEMYDIPLPDRIPKEPDDVRLKKAKLYKVVDAAARYYTACLKGEIGANARAYAARRGLSESLIKDQRMGFAPDGWDGLLRFFQKNGFSIEDGIEAGLFSVSTKTNRTFDRFRNRLIFPITDEQGRIVAFGGRDLTQAGKPSTRPKYLNSPESPIYQKGRMLYNLKNAREACRDNGQVVLVEGYMDLLAFVSRGYTRVVASLGTALTAEQVRSMARFCNEVIMVYDGDAPGQAAMERALSLFQRQAAFSTICASCIELPQGKDPDDFLKAQGIEGFNALVPSRKELGTFVIDRKLSQWDGSIAGKAALMRALEPIFAEVNLPVLEEEYYTHLATRLSTTVATLKLELPSALIAKAAKEAESIVPYQLLPGVQSKASTNTQNSLDETIFRILAHHPDLYVAVEESGILPEISHTKFYPAIIIIIAAARRGPVTMAALYDLMPDEESKQAIVRFTFDGPSRLQYDIPGCARDLLEDRLVFARKELVRRAEFAREESLRRRLAEEGDGTELLEHLRALRDEKGSAHETEKIAR